MPGVEGDCVPQHRRRGGRALGLQQLPLDGPGGQRFPCRPVRGHARGPVDRARVGVGEGSPRGARGRR
eukprot:10274765-Lingulodinium_polyedra.AAC.1